MIKDIPSGAHCFKQTNGLLRLMFLIHITLHSWISRRTWPFAFVVAGHNATLCCKFHAVATDTPAANVFLPLFDPLLGLSFCFVALTSLAEDINARTDLNAGNLDCTREGGCLRCETDDEVSARQQSETTDTINLLFLHLRMHNVQKPGERKSSCAR